MSPGMLLLLAVGLASDAVAVAIANGVVYPRRPLRLALACGLFFGFFQAVMPLIGALAGYTLLPVISRFDHWVAFGFLLLIGSSMIREARSASSREKDAPPPRLTLPVLIMQAFATSVDALAVGVGMGAVQVNMALAAALIGGVTFAGSFLGALAGKAAGGKMAFQAQMAGGCILILIGLHILAEHLEWIG